ncbi:RNA polymerase sigma factor [Lachnospiraceae bacterium PF1-22]|uniref:sigma factor n=1 Tax=Ohessyouella blattaphilus TaxID=2949333 RepID=UPI003E2BC41E
MESISERINLAKKDKYELNKLIEDYMPFIKKAVSETQVFGIDYDDKLSIAMLVFMNCIKQYSTSKGEFFAFTSVCIKNRLIDELRKESKHMNVTPLYPEEEQEPQSVEASASIIRYDKDKERQSLVEEIFLLKETLVDFGIDFATLEDISPKQKRSRILCMKMAQEICSDEKLKESFIRTKQVPQGELVRRLDISEKSIEKYRRFVVTLAIIIIGDYSGIKAFLPFDGTGKEAK